MTFVITFTKICALQVTIKNLKYGKKNTTFRNQHVKTQTRLENSTFTPLARSILVHSVLARYDSTRYGTHMLSSCTPA